MSGKLGIIKVKGNEDDHLLFILDNLLSPAQCVALINRANTLQTNGYNRSWHPPGTGGRYMRVTMIDRKLALFFEKMIMPILPETYTDEEGNTYRLLYINDHFRFSRYRERGYFHKHCDGQKEDNGRPELTGEYAAISLMTLNIPLNDEYGTDYELVGGSTSFYHECNPDKLRVKVPAKAGRAALFWFNQYHTGDEVISGFKYLLRTDVMGVLISGPKFDNS